MIASWIANEFEYRGYPEIQNPLFITVLICLHFIMSILILPNPSRGAALFMPLVTVIFSALSCITCGKLDDKINELKRWNEDGAYATEEKNEDDELLVVEDNGGGGIEITEILPSDEREVVEISHGDNGMIA